MKHRIVKVQQSSYSLHPAFSRFLNSKFNLWEITEDLADIKKTYNGTASQQIKEEFYWRFDHWKLGLFLRKFIETPCRGWDLRTRRTLEHKTVQLSTISKEWNKWCFNQSKTRWNNYFACQRSFIHCSFLSWLTPSAGVLEDTNCVSAEG